MLLIKKLSGMIEEEIEDAKKYAQCALNHKADNKQLADVFFTLANEELKHMSMLHTEVTKLIEKYRKENGEPPQTMLELYNYLHEMHIEKASEVKGLLAMYQG